MPMGNIDEIMPKKGRYDELNIEGMFSSERAYYTERYNSYIIAGCSPAEAIAYTNNEIYIDQQAVLRMKSCEAYAEKKQATEPRPQPNLGGDVTVRRMTAFLRFMNNLPQGLSEEQILEAIENEWADVIDVPISIWDSDVYGLTLHLIGGGHIEQQGSMWLYTEGD